MAGSNSVLAASSLGTYEAGRVGQGSVRARRGSTRRGSYVSIQIHAIHANQNWHPNDSLTIISSEVASLIQSDTQVGTELPDLLYRSTRT